MEQALFATVGRQAKEVRFAPETEIVATRIAAAPEEDLQALSAGFTVHNSFHRKINRGSQVCIRIPHDAEKQQKRKCTVEHPFGTVKWYDGAHYLLCKGKEKVSAEIALSFLAYNIRRLLRLMSAEGLIRHLQDEVFRQRLKTMVAGITVRE